MNARPSPPGFDDAADRYDADELGNQVLAHMRARVVPQFARAFARGARLVELGSGTGAEAARLASERVCQVALVDVSPRLLERAATKVACRTRRRFARRSFAGSPLGGGVGGDVRRRFVDGA